MKTSRSRRRQYQTLMNLAFLRSISIAKSVFTERRTKFAQHRVLQSRRN
jgi:hypothetical protein